MMNTEKLARQLRYMIDSADAVVAAWESGDLAGAVNVLDGSAEEARGILAEYDALRAGIVPIEGVE